MLTYSWLSIRIYTYSIYIEILPLKGIAIRSEYVKALLRQEVGWYDAQLTGQLTSRVASDVTMIQDATADKLGTVIQFYAMFIVGFVVAFIYSCKATSTSIWMTWDHLWRSLTVRGLLGPLCQTC